MLLSWHKVHTNKCMKTYRQQNLDTAKAKLLPCFDQYCLDSQNGGRRGRGADMAAHPVRLMLDYAALNGRLKDVHSLVV